MLNSRACMALFCLCVACSCDHTVAPAAHAAEQTVEISVRARRGDEWSSLQPDGLLSLRVEAEAGELAADLDAFLSLPEVQNDPDAAAAGPSAGAPQVTVAVDAVDVASCRLPCSVRLENVASGEHVITAAGKGPWRGLAARPCRFRLSRFDEAEAGGLVEAEGAADSNRAAHWLEPRPAVPQHGHAAEPSVGPEDTSPRADGGGRSEHQPAFDADGRYVAILFPPDDTCLTDGRNAYVSVSVTDGFFKLPRTHDILARFETTVHCIMGDNDMVLPAPLDYDPKTQGPLVQCHSYESDFTLTDGYVRKLDGSLAGTPGMGQHDCPTGTICKHDLEDGFMIDVWLVVPESGQTIQSDLAAGMHVSRFFLIDAHTRQQMGREAIVTFFVDHGTGRVCRPPSSTSVHNRDAPRERDAGSKSDSMIPATQPQPRQRRRRLQNVARRGLAVQSSTVDGADAGLAIDGSTAIGGVPGDQSASGSGRPTGRSSRTMHEPSPFWEVELEAPVQLESITVWADLRSTGSRGYPAFEVATPLAPVRIFLLDADRDVLAERVFDEEGYGNAELLTWEDIQREVVGARVQAVRLQLEFMGSTGETEHSSDLRQLAVREVQLWAWEAWDGKGRGGEGEGGGCITDADCVYGWCRGSTIGGEEGAEGGGDPRPRLCACAILIGLARTAIRVFCTRPSFYHHSCQTKNSWNLEKTRRNGSLRRGMRCVATSRDKGVCMTDVRQTIRWWRQPYSIAQSWTLKLFRELTPRECEEGGGQEGVSEIAGARKMGAAVRILFLSSLKIGGWRRHYCTLRGCWALLFCNGGRLCCRERMRGCTRMRQHVHSATFSAIFFLGPNARRGATAQCQKALSLPEAGIISFAISIGPCHLNYNTRESFGGDWRVFRCCGAFVATFSTS